MTERSQGAPDPAELSTPGPPTPGTVVAFPAMAGDLGGVRRTDALIDALAARRAVGSDDPAARMLRALIRDVDELAPARHAPAPGPAQAPEDAPEPAPADPGDGDRSPVPPAPPAGPRRRGSRTIVALGVAGAVLASGGVAAAGGGESGPPAPQRAMGPAEEKIPNAPEPVEAATTLLPRAASPLRTVPAADPVPARPRARAEDDGPDREARRTPEHVKKRIAQIAEHGTRPRRPGTGSWPGPGVEGWGTRPRLEGKARVPRGLDGVRERVQRRLKPPYRDLGDRF
ncbi:anti-sigma-D factor RsdA [Spirillospora sp. NPDC029432]|uniref:anti-sigma-D factor RsdA n=1 Tax=Spirillospora sp. NPDC029432 TaxID=3154599 RepID=UPI00345133B5